MPSQPAKAGTSDLGVSKVKIDAFLMLLFTVAIFTSATLLFVVQPMVGKILLPKLGGASAVWNTCMLFFQATLLAGYFAAHQITKRLSLRAQVVTFCSLILLAMTSLPLGVSDESIRRLLDGANPTMWLLGVLTIRVAPAFFVLSITSPLMQRWFAKSGHPSAGDPYFLYAASNIGSILALLAYPFVIEANLGVYDQTVTWMYGFGWFAVLASACGVAGWMGSQRAASPETSNTHALSKSGVAATSSDSIQKLTWQRRGFWVLMAFIPSSLMLGVTTYLSTDVASVPLIWVVPLAMYLLTFVFAFGSRQFISAERTGRYGALLILVVTMTMLSGTASEPQIIVPLHLMMFFSVALFCHQRLASDRPSADSLTEFYLCLSIGGVCGGIFNALIAPSLFSSIIEYPIIMLLASYLRPSAAKEGLPKEREKSEAEKNAGAQSTIWLGVYAVSLFAGIMFLNWAFTGIADYLKGVKEFPLPVTQICNLFIFGIPAAIVLRNLERRVHFTLGLCAIFAVGQWNHLSDPDVIEHARSFYGTVTTGFDELPNGKLIKMSHGNTVHGWQWQDASRRNTPLTYYGQSSGVAKAWQDQAARKEQLRVGAIGLGAGTLAAMAQPGDTLTFYELDPLVLDHAERYFYFLRDARGRGASVEVRLGDGRLVLEKEARESQFGEFDLLAVDAFSSDAIPTHLLTDECMGIYLSHTAEDGVIAVHISNRFLDLEPVLAALAKRHGLAAFAYANEKPKKGDDTGESMSVWVLLARSADSITRMEDAPFLKPAKSREGLRLWTDDFTNVLSVLTMSGKH